MPKETIPAWGDEKNRIDIRWSKEGFPGIALVTYSPNRRVSETIEIDALGKPLAGVEPDRETQPFNGWFTELDRGQINELIRVLRKARDQVWGPDQ